MINSIEVSNFRCLYYINQKLNDFQVLIGANASGKTTFIDTVSFLSDIVKFGIDEAVEKRSSNFLDLTYLGKGGDIELGIVLELPKKIIEKYHDKNYKYIRYEIRVGLDEETQQHSIIEESALLLKEDALQNNRVQKELFPALAEKPKTILNKKYQPKSWRRVFRKRPGGNDNFYDETQERSGKGWMPSFKFGIKKAALSNLPDYDKKFPASIWLKEFLMEGIQIFVLESLNIRNPSPPGQTKKFKPDGSNLPWVIEELKKNNSRYEAWINHIKLALPDIVGIDIIERPEDKHKYISVKYECGAKVPSWLVSDGTLRLLALTLPAYINEIKGLFLIEEPENGIHPKAMEIVYQSLSSVYNAQVLLASHSPVVLSMVKPKDVLCFAKTETGTTDVINGAEHPKLKDWKSKAVLSDLFAGGILG
ncbi:MAG: methylation-associated defense system AAA family ATPase MAD3 [Candidatus Goldiibacteriota bacterium]